MANPWAAEDDDDVPPPLSSLAEQVEALHVVASTSQDAGQAAAQEQQRLRVASCTVSSGSNTTAADAGALQQPAVSASTSAATPKLKKGFFDSKPASKQVKSASQQHQQDSIPVLKGRKDGLGASQNQKAIPDFLRVEPDEQEIKYKEMRNKLVDALKPDRDTIEKIASDKALAAAFEDPDVMAAVNDIAQNPQSWSKYQNNKKVLAFYSAMGSLMGQRLEGMGPAVPGGGNAIAAPAQTGKQKR